MVNVSNHLIVNWASNRELYFKKHWFLICAKTTFLNFYLENYLLNKKISNKKKMHLDANSNHIFFISNFYAFRLSIDYRESTVQFKRRVPLFDPGIEFWLSKFNVGAIIFRLYMFWSKGFSAAWRTLKTEYWLSNNSVHYEWIFYSKLA